MLQAPRIIVIDDEQEHLESLARGLNRYGTVCLPIHFIGEVPQIPECPSVRVIFADLHLNPGASGEHSQHFSILGGLIEKTIKPSGPYLIILWTRYPDQAENLFQFLTKRLQDVRKPFAVHALDFPPERIQAQRLQAASDRQSFREVGRERLSRRRAHVDPGHDLDPGSPRPGTAAACTTKNVKSADQHAAPICRSRSHHLSFCHFRRVECTTSVMRQLEGRDSHALIDLLLRRNESSLGKRLIFAVHHDPLPRKDDGGIDMQRVTAIMILEIVDYH